MKKQNSITFYIDEDKEDLIKKASDLSGLSVSAYCKTTMFQKAKEKLNKEDDTNETRDD